MKVVIDCLCLIHDHQHKHHPKKESRSEGCISYHHHSVLFREENLITSKREKQEYGRRRSRRRPVERQTERLLFLFCRLWNRPKEREIFLLLFRTGCVIFALLQFVITVNIREKSLNLPENPSHAGIRKHLSDLSQVLRKPEIAYSIAWIALSTAVVPVLTGTMFFYQTKFLKIDASLLGISKVFGQVAMLLWGVAYNRFLKSIRPRKLIAAIQGTIAVFVISDLLFVKGFYRDLGVPDSVYVLFFSGFLETLFYFKILPFTVLMTRLCPPGCEGSLMAFVMSAIALAFIVSGYLGIVLASFVGVTVDDFSGFTRGLAIEAICVGIPLVLTSWIYDEAETKEKSKKKE